MKNTLPNGRCNENITIHKTSKQVETFTGEPHASIKKKKEGEPHAPNYNYLALTFFRYIFKIAYIVIKGWKLQLLSIKLNNLIRNNSTRQTI